MPIEGDGVGVGEAFGVADGGVLSGLWLPASEWCTSPSRRWPSRVQMAISGASRGSPVGTEAAVRQPTMLRENSGSPHWAGDHPTESVGCTTRA